ncbi:uncharacterized protein LOC142378437 isoform X26 [Odontesthes bonariensis]|uniref:uncharacterized protein LOC142378437 isoform X26 n=1 Tax=Odontesthes bonariensis TaxID=219752 RepID=UPI003F581E5A
MELLVFLLLAGLVGTTSAQATGTGTTPTPGNSTSSTMNTASPSVNQSTAANATSAPVQITSTSVNTTSSNTASPPAVITSSSSGHASSPAVSENSTTSIITTGAPTTVRTTTPAPPPEPKISLGFSLKQTFTPELGNASSPAFKELETKVTSALNNIYSQKFGEAFNRTIIKGFRSGSVVADVELVFNEGQTLPNATAAADTLVEAAASGNLSLPVNASTIVARVVETPTVAPVTTAPSTASAPISTTKLPTNVTSSPINLTTQLVNMTSPPVSPTTQLSNITSPHLNMTSSPTVSTSTILNATSLPLNQTSPPVSPTTQLSNITSPHLNMTSSPTVSTSTILNATSLPLNQTSPPVSPTTQLSNITSPPLNMTSPALNATSPPLNMTSPASPQVSTTPLPGHASSPAVSENSTTSIITTGAPTTVRTTTPAPPPEPKISLGFSLKQTFTPELGNASSPAFKELETKVTSALNNIYSQKFGEAFNRTIIKGFRSGSVVADVELVFNEGQTLPNATAAADTLVEAAASGNLSLPVNASTIVARVVETPTVAPVTTAPSTASAPISTTKLPTNVTSSPINLTTQLVNMTSPPVSPTTQLSNITSPHLNMTSSPTVSTSTILNATSLPLNQTSPPVSPTTQPTNITSPHLNMTSPALNATSPPLNMTSPTSPQVSTTPLPALNATSPPLNMTSPTSPQVTTTPLPANVTQPNITTVSTIITTAVPAPPRVSLGFSLQQNFSSDLGNETSPVFLALAKQVQDSLDLVYKNKFGNRFVRSKVRSFRQGSVVVDAELIFNDTSSVPEDNEVANTLVEAANSSNPNFTLSVNTATIVATRVVTTTVVPSTSVGSTVSTVAQTSPPLTSTSSPLNATSPPLNATSAPVNITSPALNATSPTVNMTSPTLNATSPPLNVTSVPPLSTTSPTAATTTATVIVTTAAPPETTVKLGFSLQQTFTSGLSNSDSDEFKTLANRIQEALDSIYRTRFGVRFLRSLIRAFRQGSVVVDADLVFHNASSVPETTEVANALVTASNSSNFTLPLNTSSVVATRINATTQPTTPTTVNMTSPTLNGTSPPLNVTSVPTLSTTSPTAATTSATVIVTTAAPPESTVKLGFSLQQTFTSGLSNSDSDEFKTLANRIQEALDSIYRTRFGVRFLRSLIRAFRQGSVVVDADLVFHNASSVPETTEVANALVTASNSSNFTLPLNTSSVVATRINTTTQPTTPTTASATSPPVNMTSPPLNATSPPVNITSPPLNATSAPVNITSPALNATSPTVNMTSPTLNATSPPLNVTSVPTLSTTSPTAATTTATVIVTTAAPPESTVKLGFSLQQTFTSGLSNSDSDEFKTLANRIQEVLDSIYRTRFGVRFLRSLIRAFRQGSVVVDADLVFHNASSVPETTEVANALVTASNSSNFTLPLNTSSVVATRINATQPTTPTTASATSPPVNMTSPPLNATSPPVNITSPPLNATSAPVNITSPALNATSPTVNMTSPTLNATSPPLNVTSVPTLSTTSPTAATTTATVIVTTAAPPESTVKLGFSLQQTFTSGLSNSDSDEFKTLANRIQEVLDSIYRTRFGVRFLRSLIRAFRQGSVVVDADLVFHNASSVPETTEVANALVTASNSSNFTLPLNTSSVVATRINTTTQPTTPTTASATSPPVNITSPPLNATSPPVNMTSPPLNATSPTVNMTSPTLNATSPPLNATSPPLSTTSPTAATTTATVIVTTAAPPETTVQLGFSLQQTFTSGLSNSDSDEFKTLANRIQEVLDSIYRTRFGVRFLRSLIRAFRQGSVVVDADLVFHNASSVPETTEVANALVTASNSSNFTLPLNTSSVVATRINTTTQPTTPTTASATSPPVNITSPPLNATSAPVNMTSPPLNATSPTVNMTSPTLNATSPPLNATSPPLSTTSPTAATTTATVIVTTAAPPETTVQLGFSLQQTFTSGLSNSDSDEFKTLANRIQEVLDSIYRTRFGVRFLRSLIRAFRQGSVVVDADLVFRNASSVPETTEVANALVTASNSSNFTLPLNISSVVATRINTTTQPTTPTTASATSPQLNSTSSLANMTSPSLNATSPTASATSPPVNITSPPLNVTSPTASATSPPVNMTSPPLNSTSPPVNVTSVPPLSTTSPTAVTTTATVIVTNAAPPETIVKLGFSLRQTFTSGLLNSDSDEFKTLANRIQEVLDSIYRTRFGVRFLRSLIRAFRQGSVVVDADLVFRNASSVPETTEVENALVTASNNSNFTLPLNTSSVVATRINTTQPTTPTTVSTTTVATTAAPTTAAATTAAATTAAPTTAAATTAAATTAAPTTVAATTAPSTTANAPTTTTTTVIFSLTMLAVAQVLINL